MLDIIQALYSLLSCGHLQRGSSILIHCGAGGLGMAAINICLHYGCEIFTTVGTHEKRKFIRSQFPSVSQHSDSLRAFLFIIQAKISNII